MRNLNPTKGVDGIMKKYYPKEYAEMQTAADTRTSGGQSLCESESPMQTHLMKPNERQGVKPVSPSRRHIQNMQEVKQDE